MQKQRIKPDKGQETITLQKVIRRNLKCNLNEVDYELVKQFDILSVDLQNREIITVLHGPPGTPYETFDFRISYQYSHRYPFEPPTVRFMDKIWNPFVDFASGKICCSILENRSQDQMRKKQQDWSPAFGLQSIIVSVSSLISQNKNIEQGLNAQATYDIQCKYSKFYEQARKYAQKYAYTRNVVYLDEEKPGVSDEPEKDKQLVDQEYERSKQQSIKNIKNKKQNQSQKKAQKQQIDPSFQYIKPDTD